MFKKIFYLTIILLLFNILYSNGNINITGGFGGFMVGGFYQDLSTINQVVSQYGFDNTKDLHFFVGGGGGGIVNNLYFGGWGGSSMPEVIDNSSVMISINQSYGFSQFGYLFYINDNFMIIPAIGFGGKSISMNISPATTTNVNFNNILINPGHSSSLNYSPTSYNFNLLLLIPVNFMMFGINIGYIFSPQTAWQVDINYMNSLKLLNAPKISEHSVYLNLGIYFGSYSKNIIKEIKNDELKEKNDINENKNQGINKLKEKVDETLKDLKNE